MIFKKYLQIYINLHTSQLISLCFGFTILFVVRVSYQSQIYNMREQKFINEKGPEYFANFLSSEGNLYKYGHSVSNSLSPSTVTMQPYQMRQSDFNQLKDLNEIWAKLFIKMSQDYQAIELLHGGSNDQMIKKLLAIAKKVSNTKYQKTKAIFFRNDYMYDDEKNKFLQTQINLISVGLWMISQKTQKFHEIVNQLTDSNWMLYREPCIEKLTDFFIQLLEIYAKQFNQPKPYMLKVAEGNGGCVIEQITIDKQLLLKRHKIINGNFDNLLKRMIFDQTTGKLTVDGFQIGLIYYRNGYMQDHYPTDQCWKVRQILQCSRAIKIPNAQIQLVNFKSAQTLIQTTDIAKKYLSEEESEKIKKFQTKFWTTKEIQTNLEEILKQNGQNLVVKSIHEGSEQNYFYKDAHRVLRQNRPQKYIVMELIKSKGRPVTILKKGKQFVHYNGISEFSLYSTVIYNQKEIEKHKYISYAVRTYEQGQGQVEILTGRKGMDSIAFI